MDAFEDFSKNLLQRVVNLADVNVSLVVVNSGCNISDNNNSSS